MPSYVSEIRGALEEAGFGVSYNQETEEGTELKVSELDSGKIIATVTVKD